MKSTNNQIPLFRPIIAGVLVGLACVLPAQPANADDELRAGAVLQVPFNLGSNRSFFDPTTIRVGLTGQYADIEEDEITITRTINVRPDPDVIMHTTAREDEGDQVVGLEGNVFIEIFNDFNGSAELLGFYGSNTIQGAAGAGYSFSDGSFLDVKAMFPYAEIGMRLMGQPEIYGGAKTLGQFEPAKDIRRIDLPVIPQ